MKRKSLTRQVEETLKDKLRIGQSKHDAKVAGTAQEIISLVTVKKITRADICTSAGSMQTNICRKGLITVIVLILCT